MIGRKLGFWKLKKKMTALIKITPNIPSELKKTSKGKLENASG